MSEEGVNLDGMDIEDLNSFSENVVLDPDAVASVLFPSKPANYIAATKLLCGYANSKAMAMRVRAEGQIDLALKYEAVCERLYKLLPEFARW